MDSLNYFLQDMNMPTAVRQRAREYLRNTRELRKRLSYSELIDKLSPDLREEVGDRYYTVTNRYYPLLL